MSNNTQGNSNGEGIDMEEVQVQSDPEANSDDSDSDIEDVEMKSSPVDAGLLAENEIDTDEDDSDLDEEEKLLNVYIATLSEISENKFSYDSYIKLTETAHKLNHLDKIRQAYEIFASAFPLAPELWLKYLQIEANLAASAVEVQKVQELFRKALADYYSADVALEFAKFADKTDNPEEIWSEVLSTYALHCMKGRKFFEEYRKYNESRNVDQKVIRDAYIQSYKRELRLPLYDMEESYIEFKVFCEKNKPEVTVDWEVIEKDYNRAKTHLQRILPYEKQIVDLDPKFHQERALSYRTYIKEADKFLDESILQTLYERMVAECCLNADCWLEYIKFLEYRDKYGLPSELEGLQKFPVFAQTEVDVNWRSIRNCTWSDKLYISLMQLLEKRSSARTEVQEVLEKGLAVVYQAPEPAVALWLEYLGYLRRQTNFEDENDMEILRKNFDLCWNTLGKQWGVLADCSCEILQFWGRMEYGPLRDPARGKDLWMTVMESSDNATNSGLWIEFIQLEMRRDLENTRKLFKKALSSYALDNPSVISSAWIRFERCNGNLKQLIASQKQCETLLVEIEAENRRRLEKAELKTKAKGTKRKAAVEDEPMPMKTTRKEVKEKPVEKEFKKPEYENKDHGSSSQKTSRVLKEHENDEIDLSKDHLRIFLSNLDYNITEEEIRKGLPELQITNIDLIQGANGKGRGFGYVELVSEEEVEKALQFDRRLLRGRPLYISSVLRDKEKRLKFKYSDGLEPKKLFVKGLPYDVSKEELEDLFKEFGKLSDVRLVYHKSGKSKGIAYIEFENEKSSSQAVLKMDQYELRGHTINVAISAPPPKTSTKDPVNVSKLLGIGGNRRTGPKSDQKPRMSLIPTSVRKQVLHATTSAPASQPKSNDDFRKLLGNK